MKHFFAKYAAHCARIYCFYPYLIAGWCFFAHVADDAACRIGKQSWFRSARFLNLLLFATDLGPTLHWDSIESKIPLKLSNSKFLLGSCPHNEWRRDWTRWRVTWNISGRRVNFLKWSSTCAQVLIMQWNVVAAEAHVVAISVVCIHVDILLIHAVYIPDKIQDQDGLFRSNLPAL